MKTYADCLAELERGEIECPCGETGVEFINGYSEVPRCARCADPDNMSERQMNAAVGGGGSDAEYDREQQARIQAWR